MLMNMAQALNSALDVMLNKDDKVVVFGEDVGVMGGVFLITEGLMEKYGNMRVFDTPISEAGIVGMAIGLAMGGYKPVVEIQFSGFSYLAFNQIISHLSRWKYRSLGKFKMSVVVRMPNGGGVRGPELHSESIENYMLATPGLKVVYPSNPYDAKGLLISSIEDEEPVIFLEHIKLYRYEKADVPEGYYKEEIGKAKIVQEGNDLSIITYGYGVVIAREFAKKSGLSIEIVDLRTIAPLDKETILKSVKKTGRAVIISENHKTLSVASEISAIISEEAIEYLIAPIERVCSMDIPYPPSTLEDEYLPNEEKLKRAVDRVMSYD